MDAALHYEPLQIACRYQRNDESGLFCGLAKLHDDHSTTQTSEDVCRECQIGRISRELGCINVGGSVQLLEYRPLGAEVQVLQGGCDPYCRLLRRGVEWDYCYACPHTHRPIAQEAIQEARGLLGRLGFAESEKGLYNALLAFQAGKYADTVLKAKAALESCLHSVLQNPRVEYDPKADMGELWKAAKTQTGIWNLPSTDATKQIDSGIVSIILGASTIRSQQTDAHGRAETPETSLSQAELVLNCAATLCLFLARRLDEVGKQAG
jgi:HEPN domain-containing protein